MTPANDFDKVSEAMEFAWQRMGLMYDDGLLYEGRDALESLRAQVTELELERDGLRAIIEGLLVVSENHMHIYAPQVRKDMAALAATDMKEP